MTDLKTVREALRIAEKKCFDATGRIDLELSSSITQALAALDRIEAVETVTEKRLATVLYNIREMYDKETDGDFDEYASRALLKTFRIVKEK